jgi:hypothetical protein
MKRGELLASLSILVGSVGQSMTLPLFISTFSQTGKGAGVYFVLFILSIMYLFPFGFAHIKDKYNGKKLVTKWEPELFWIGFTNAINGLLVVFSSALGRTSGPLQSILQQVNIPNTMIFSRLLYGICITRQEKFGAIIVIAGILISTIPSFIKIANGTHAASDWFYPLMFLLGNIPGVLANVIQKGIFNKHKHHQYSQNYILWVESLIQLVVVALLFEMDLVPMFGTSKNMSEFNDNFEYGFQCFFDPKSQGGRCDLSWVFGCLFTLFYCFTYWGTTYLVDKSTANFGAIVNAFGPPIQMTIWFSWPWLTRWGGGNEYDNSDMICGLIAMFVLILPGSIIYKYYENKRLERERDDFSVTEVSPLMHA